MLKKFFGLIFAGLFLFLPKPVWSASFTFNPDVLEKNVGEVFSLEIRLESTETVVGADLNLTYDPQLLEVTKLTPGAFFVNPQILTNKIDSAKGQVNYSAFSYPGNPGSASFLILSTRLLNTSSSSIVVKLETSSLLAGSKGKKISLTLGQAVIRPGTIQVSPTSVYPTLPPPTPTSALLYPTNSPTQGIYTTPWPTSPAQAPTIYVEGKPTTTPAKGQPTKSILPILGAVILIVTGIFALLLLKRTSRNNV